MSILATLRAAIREACMSTKGGDVGHTITLFLGNRDSIYYILIALHRPEEILAAPLTNDTRPRSRDGPFGR